MKKKDERMEKQMAEISAKNKMLAEPLQKAQEEVEELKKELANYEKDKETLRVCILPVAGCHTGCVCRHLYVLFFDVHCVYVDGRDKMNVKINKKCL